jgi:hypothetical protein
LSSRLWERAESTPTRLSSSDGGNSSTTRGKQDLSFRRHDDQFQAMVSDEGIIQMLWKDIQIDRRTNPFEGVLGKFQFAREHFHILLFEMPL